MNLSSIGEFGFIKRFSGKFDDLLGPGSTGIGDDCAVIPVEGDGELVVSTDMLVEDVHFLRDKISSYDLGYKSLAVNLSDIAAMGGSPVASFLSLAIPPDLDLEYMDCLLDGYHDLSRRFAVPLMGGDTTRSGEKLVISVTILGKVAKGRARLRSGAQTGDIVAVTGKLGDSAAGLHILLNSLGCEGVNEQLVAKHTKPEPCVKEGSWLATQDGVNCMMDVSDGIASDIGHILNRSGKGAVIDLNGLPLSDELRTFCSDRQLDPYYFATSGGEDYCLLLTICKELFDSVAKAYSREFSTCLYPIGQITDGSELTWKKDGKVLAKGPGKGFRHF